MNTHAKVAISLTLVGLLAIAGYKFGWPFIQEKLDRESSDARDIKAKLVVGVDNWIGYFPLCSSEMRKRMIAQTRFRLFPRGLEGFSPLAERGRYAIAESRTAVVSEQVLMRPRG